MSVRPEAGARVQPESGGERGFEFRPNANAPIGSSSCRWHRSLVEVWPYSDSTRRSRAVRRAEALVAARGLTWRNQRPAGDLAAGASLSDALRPRQGAGEGAGVTACYGRPAPRRKTQRRWRFPLQGRLRGNAWWWGCGLARLWHYNKHGAQYHIRRPQKAHGSNNQTAPKPGIKCHSPPSRSMRISCDSKTLIADMPARAGYRPLRER